MPTKKAQARWEGDLQTGHGQLESDSGALRAPFSFGTRFSDNPGTSPEELIAAAHAGCFSMAFSALLSGAGHKPRHVATEARVRLEKMDQGFAITAISLKTTASVPGIEQQEFLRLAEEAKVTCPVSKALAGSIIEVEAELEPE